MFTTPNQRDNAVIPFGETGNLGGSPKTYQHRFRTFSVYNNSGTCTVTLKASGNVMNIPVGVTVNFDAAEGRAGDVNRFVTGSFTVEASDCVIVGTI
tara:strand:+ start:671 stop:961 length:291 start_codon:yes stop_codon:yes gene_type:complete